MFHAFIIHIKCSGMISVHPKRFEVLVCFFESFIPKYNISSFCCISQVTIVGKQRNKLQIKNLIRYRSSLPQKCIYLLNKETKKCFCLLSAAASHNEVTKIVCFRLSRRKHKTTTIMRLFLCPNQITVSFFAHRVTRMKWRSLTRTWLT